MRKDLEQLLEIQDLELILAETRILHLNTPDQEVKRVRQTVADKRQGLNPELLRRYDQLRRNGVAVVREKDGVCGGCRLKVPKGDLRRMQRGAIPWVCPNCSRFLLLT